ncbi:DNA-directed RNA polymerase subunit alpha C-terminal domain-containing protein [Neorhizobium alkalisoli]|uniref:RNA polymerase alpha subunit n=1 Tax=Neorhizobium alkalisoli TaxID=528178 RepID=A0A561QHT4_9HYPH|nr:DNA-directed RNA polymerase subunit alpha C-terminal domain-containing protein [Neorhizobium alkalisoli]TWF49902.1 RNA polymerase alpha subunit [Neorhizobium alkalisoli]
MHAKINFLDNLETSELSHRLIGTLRQSGIARLSYLYAMTDERILRIPHVGQCSLREIRRVQQNGF